MFNFKTSNMEIVNCCQRLFGCDLPNTGSNIPWVTEMRYLGVYFVQSRYLKCSLTVAKRGFYRAANSIGKIGRCTSEEVILQLISSKCIPILLYGLEVLPMQKYQLNSLDFIINRFFYEII